jgi:hypothetical protein
MMLVCALVLCIARLASPELRCRVSPPSRVVVAAPGARRGVRRLLPNVLVQPPRRMEHPSP